MMRSEGYVPHFAARREKLTQYRTGKNVHVERRLPLPAFFLIWYGPARDKEMIMGKKS